MYDTSYQIVPLPQRPVYRLGFLRTLRTPLPPVHFLLTKIAQQCNKVLRGISCRIGMSTPLAASDGESGLKHRGDKKFYDSIPRLRSGTLDKGDLDGDDVATVLDVDAVIRQGG